MSAIWNSLHLLRPHALWLLLALPLLWWLWRLRQRHANVWRDVVDPHLLPHLLAKAGRGSHAALLGLGLAYALAVLALAGPSWRQGEQPLWQQHAPLVIALDLSSATAAADLPPSRLLQARSKLATLLRERTAGQVALVAFAGDAFTVAPLTDDAHNVALFLDALSPDVMPIDGQRADRAIAWSAKLLKQAGFDRGDILLLTDHGDAAAQAAAATAVQQGYRVSALGLGTAGGASYRTGEGGLARTRLDAGSLQALARSGNGQYQTLRRDGDDLVALGVLDPQTVDGGRGQGDGKAWLDEGYWLLLPLMVLALFAFRRGASLILLGGCSLLWALPSQAAERDWWQRADQREHAQIEQGVQAYRNGDYAAAEQAFTGKDNAEALYNRGNALAKQGRYDEAIAAYDAALKRQPGMADAIANRAAVDRARRQPSDPSGKGADGKSGSQGQSSPPPPPPQDAAQKQAAPPPTEPAKPPPATRTPSSPPPSQKPADPQAQQAADAAQRERMQQALARQAQQDPRGKRDGKAQAADETQEQRERRQALEAWLRRVPDDPGGLLKAKFQLEHERRMREGQ